MKSNEIRKVFLDYFKEKRHTIFSSDTVVPKDDPTLLFTSAGMNQFKPYFLGIKKDVKRAASVQKCLRTGDLENVGRTSSHHTFFEMLGNFSFGDYFKKEAIEFAWEFLTQRLHIPKERLWISVYKDDGEAYRLWQEHIGVSPNMIVKLGDEDNFWPANVIQNGPDGPCGPCSEIYVDLGKGKNCPDPARCNPACPCRRFVEVWNLVFTQYNRVNGVLQPLPSKNIDTGMGLERLCSVLQGVDTNFKTDVFTPILQNIKEVLKKTDDVPSLYVIADHIRAIYFAISDGVLPSNEDRGYVIRKLIRRAFWTAHSWAGIHKPFLYSVIPAINQSMGAFYTENFRAVEDVEKIIYSEEEKFLSTMEFGKKLLFEKIDDMQRHKKTVIPGDVVFKLYDTYGFPIDLTERIAEENHLSIDRDGFTKLMGQQKEISKKSSKFEESIFGKKIDTGDLKSTFVGYDQDAHQSKIIGIICGDHLTQEIARGARGGIILHESVFYPESGGQMHDTGIIKTDLAEFVVEQVQKRNECIVCAGTVRAGTFRVNDRVSCAVDLRRRDALKRAHTSTHLLQAALRKCLGQHVKQQGSLVEEDRFRFDFSHFSKVNPEELKAIERQVNAYIYDAQPVSKREMSYKEAQEQKALAFFQEKYDERVRVITIKDTSAELCGGLHLDITVAAGVFKIISESSISSGIRRIEGVCGEAAYKEFTQDSELLSELIGALKSTRKDVLDSVQKITVRVKELEKQLQEKELLILQSKIEQLVISRVIHRQNIALFIHKVDEGVKMLQWYNDLLHKRCVDMPLLIMVFSQSEGNTHYVCSINKGAAEKGVDCGRFMEQVFSRYPGKGSQKPDYSRGVINRPEVPEEAIIRIAEEYIDAHRQK